jgi:ABC-type taurine transport system substrate-binding protein
MGKATLFTPRRRRRILLALREGATLAGAAQAGGVAARTLDGWLARGREASAGPVWSAFARDVDEARAAAEAEAVASWGDGVRTVSKSSIDSLYGSTKQKARTFRIPVGTGMS